VVEVNINTDLKEAEWADGDQLHAVQDGTSSETF